MTEYAAQIARIKAKLPIARAADEALKVFAADSHRYKLREPVTEAALLQLEADYGLRFPEPYRRFMREVGNGGAGPFYGVYQLGHGLYDLGDNPQQYLRQPCRLHPDMTDAQWKELTRAIEVDDDLSDETYELALNELYAGVMPLGTQGCAITHAMVLNGPFAGRVVYIDPDNYLPHFAYEATMLDWYERWLDQVVAGDQGPMGGAFGYHRGGPEAALLHLFQTTPEASVRAECVVGLQGKKQLSPPVLQALVAYEPGDDVYLQLKLAQLLLRFDYAQARTRLLALVPDNLLGVLQSIFWYAKSHCADWLPVIAANLHRIQDSETLSFATYVLEETTADYGALLLPFAASPNHKLRLIALHSLSKLPNKSDYLATFITGLYDAVPDVVHTALQAVSDLPDPQLRPHYQAVATRFGVVDGNYIMVNIAHALKTQGISLERLMRRDYGGKEQG